MKRFLILAVIVLLCSCKFSGDTPISTRKIAKDSALFYFTHSLDGALSPIKKKQALNKALFLARNLKEDSLYTSFFYQKCHLIFSLGEYDSLLVLNKLLQEHALRTNDIPILARQHYLMGYYFDEVASMPDSAFNNYNSSKNYFLLMQDSSWVGRSLLNMGIIQKNQNDFFGSKETLTEAEKYLVLSESDGDIPSLYNALATNHRKLLNFEDAIAYYQEAMELVTSNEDKRILKNNLATTFIDSKQYDMAISLLNEIVGDSLLIQNPREYGRVLDNLAYAQWLSGTEWNEKHFLDALEIRREAKDRRGLIASYTHLGEFHSQTGPQMARAYFDSVIWFSKSLKMPRAETDVLGFLMKLEPNNVDFKDRYIFLQDSLYGQELKVKTQFAKYKYDNQVVQEKSLRLEKENAQKELEVTRQRTQKIISFFGLALLLLAISFIVYYFKQRTQGLAQENKTAKLEATWETEAEMSRRLHDDFGAGLHQAMLMVQGDTDKTKVLDRLDGLYNQSRNFSREINEVDTGRHFKEEFLEMLRYRTPDSAKLLISGNREVDWERMATLSKKVLYKVLQELMINMGRHSGATLVTIGFEERGNMLMVGYTDNGVGASEQDLKAKNGLRNTEKRIQAIGGTITFGSGKGEGFRVQLEIPK